METIIKQNENELKIETSREPIVQTIPFETIVTQKKYWDNLYNKAVEFNLKSKEELEENNQ